MKTTKETVLVEIPLNLISMHDAIEKYNYSYSWFKRKKKEGAIQFKIIHKKIYFDIPSLEQCIEQSQIHDTKNSNYQYKEERISRVFSLSEQNYIALSNYMKNNNVKSRSALIESILKDYLKDQ